MAGTSGRWRAKGGERRMSLAEHLRELRKRLFISAIAIVATAVASFIWLAPWLITALEVPIDAIAENRNAEMIYTTVTGSFDLRMQVAVTIALVLASPVWLYQLFAFLVPGLTSRERKYTFGFFFTAVPLFFGGVAAGWFVFPHMVQLLTSFAGESTSTTLIANTYYDFFIKLVLAVGIAFVLPVFLVLLNFVGVLSARSIIKGWRIAILAIVAFCAIATPAADVISMFLLAIPMVLLYFAAAFVAWLHDRRAARRAAQLETSIAT